MKLTRKLVLFLVLGMGAVLCLDAWVGVSRETALLRTDMKADEHSVRRALAVAAAEFCRHGENARARDLIEKAGRVALPLTLTWIDVDGPGRASALPPGTLERLDRDDMAWNLDRATGPFGMVRSYLPVRVDQEL